MKSNWNGVVGLLLLAIVVLGGKFTSMPVENPLLAQTEFTRSAKRILGAVATIQELDSGLEFIARVDTGAKTCSLHAAEKHVLEGSQYMEDNLGKTVRFRVVNRQGETQWLERTIVEVREIRTSEGEEVRYLVPMTLECNGVKREVHVSLNDRSRMDYTMLLGRNYLSGEFIVDVTGADDSPELLASGL